MSNRLVAEIALWALVALGAYFLIVLVPVLHARRFRKHYREHFAQTRRERLFLASVAFFLTFATVRVITHAIRAGVGPFHNVEAGGRHIHHLVWGILLLLLVGYGWLVQVGTGVGHGSVWMGRLMALLYGAGAALTLDEFALWLNLRDVYWSREGRASVDAAFLFGGMLSVGIWGGTFLHAVTREAWRRLQGR